MKVTEADVTLAYRFILGREPESQELVRAHLDCADVEALRRRFLGCAEFRNKLGGWLAEAQTLQPASSVPLSVPAMTVELEPRPAELERMAARIEAAWRRLGTSEPHWSVLSTDDYLSARIAQHEEAFYASSAYDAELLKSAVERHGGRLERLETCLEYGCGVGRATWKLAPLFRRLVACDISETHLELARRFLSRSGVGNVELRKIDSPLRPLDGLQYDVFFSRIVLQHNPPPLMAAVLRAALAGLRPGGFALFQLPTYGRGYSFRVHEYLDGPEDGRIEMHCLPQAAVFELARAASCDVLDVREDADTGQPETYVSNTFVLRRQG